MVIHILFTEKSMFATAEAVIGGENEVGIVAIGKLIELVEEFADLGIEMGNDGIELASMCFDREFGAGHGGEFFVSETMGRAHWVTVRIARKKVFGDFDAVEGIAVEVFLRGLAGVVGSIE